MHHETRLLRFWRDLNHACPHQHVTLELASVLFNLGYSVADAVLILDASDDGAPLVELAAIHERRT